MRWAVLIQTAIGITLLVAAASKLASGDSVRPFLDALGLPSTVSAVVAWLVVPLEAVSGVLLVAGVGSVALAVAAGLCVGFVGLLAAAHRSGVTQGCRCFGMIDNQDSTAVAVVRAAVLAVASVVALALALRAGRPASLLASDRSTFEAIVVGGCAAATYIGTFALAGEVLRFERHRRSRTATERRAA